MAEDKIFFCDERYVPADDVKSNYHMAYEHLFSKVPISPENIYRIPTEFDDPNDAAKEYEKTIKHALQVKTNHLPEFDLCYLGLGENAHTASLMPMSDLVKFYMENISSKNQPLVAALFTTEPNRITLMPNVINNSKNIIFLVTEENKATAVWNVLEEKTNPLQYPAQLINCAHGKTFWYLDQLAAGKLAMLKNNE